MSFDSIGCCGWMICLQSLHSVGVVTIQSFILCPICLVPFGYFITWLYFCIIIILHGFVLFFFFFALHGVCVVRIMGYVFGGGSYSTVYVPPPFYVFPMVFMLHILSFFFFSVFCVLISFSISTPVFSFSNLCVFFHAWMKTFGGCGCICIICSPIHVF